MKKYKNREALIVCFLFGFLLFSCNKYLDKKSNSKLVTPQTLSDLQAILDQESMTDQSTPSYDMVSADEYFLNDDELGSLDISQQYNYVWKYYPDNFSNDWSTSYNVVYNANLVLDLLGNISETTSNMDEWNNVKGSALFYRSYQFLELLWDYAKAYDSSTANKDLGIVLRLTSDFNVKSTRATNQQCYEQIVKDTKAAVGLLPAYPQQVMRPSQGAAYGLLARCFLSMRDYKDALLYTDSCLQLNNRLMDYNGDGDITNPISGDAPFKQFNKEVIFYSSTNTLNYMFFTALIGSIDSVLYASYANNDLRKQGYFAPNADGYTYFKGSYTANDYDLFTGIATDEMYLTRAECYIRTGQIRKGINDMDSLLSKRLAAGTFMPLNINSQKEALDTVLSERRKELVMRGFRWPDIKRLNKEGANILLKRIAGGQIYTLAPNADFYALPLPDDIIQITGMQQNE